MAQKKHTYLCFDGDTDMKYYRLLQAWDANDSISFTFENAHDLMQSRDSSLEETIKRSLRERMRASSEFMVLIGKNTKNLYKFVRWEMEVALELNLPIIAVNLNDTNGRDDTLCPPIIRDKLVVHIPFELKMINHALKFWPDEYIALKSQGKVGPRIYDANKIKAA